jgi:tRNA threonylcarbamoyladenosine biosynthesis protein TsaE
MEIKTAGYKKTQDLGKIFAQEVLRKGLQKRAVVLALEGDLGGGKTTFAQGFAKGLGIKEKITSPTFVIFKKFKVKNGRLHGQSKFPSFENFYHFDCYRLLGSEDASALGFEEIISSPKNIVLLEWARNIEELLPQETIWLKFDFVSKNKRNIVLSEKKVSAKRKVQSAK